MRAVQERNTTEQGEREKRERELRQQYDEVVQNLEQSLTQKDEVIAAGQGEMEQLRPQQHAVAMATSQQQENEIKQL